MRTRLLAVVLIVSGLFVTADKSYACGPPPPANEDPVADLTVIPQYAAPGRTVILDGSGSYDPDGSVVKYEWDFNYNGSSFDPNYYETSSHHPDGKFDGITAHAYGNTDTYTVALRVTDDDNATNTDTTCKVYVGRVFNIDDGLSYDDIQSAISATAAGNGDTIVVTKGTYTGSNNRNIDFDGKAIILRSTDPNNPDVVAKTVIDCEDAGRGFYFDNGEGTGSVVDGLTIINGYASGSGEDAKGGGIYCNGASPTISNCVIADNNSTGYGGGMYCYGSASPTVTNCVFSGNRATGTNGFGGGMYTESASCSPTITNCTFSGNAALYGGGMLNQNGSSPELINCIFVGNSASSGGGGMYNYSSPSTEVISCTFHGNEDGMYNNNSDPNITNCIFWGNGNTEIDPCNNPNVSYCDVEGGYTSGGTGNIDSDPCFVDANNPAGPDGIFATRDDGLFLRTDSSCIDAGNNSDVDTETDIIGNQRIADGDHVGDPNVDMGAYELPTIWYVDGSVVSDGNGVSWDDAYKDLQDALTDTDVNDGNEIWVADGKYKPDGSDPNNRSISFELIEGVALYGGFNGSETSLNGRDWVNNETILSGDINEPSNPYDNSYNVVEGADGAVLDGFTITAGGSGIYCTNVSPTIINCIITDNMWNAGIRSDGSDASPTIINCTIIDNSGSGVYNEYGPSPKIINCAIADNEGLFGGGGMDNLESTPTVINCVFSGNYGYSGGGIHNDDSYATLTNCTFSGNNASGRGGGMYNSNDSLSIVANCIFWDNNSVGDGNEIYNSSSNPVFGYCDIAGSGGSDDWNPSFGADAGGNIDSDPCFTEPYNPTGSDGIFRTPDDGLRLRINSHCVDEGDNFTIDEVGIAVDITGRPRKTDGKRNGTITVDMGAYEATAVWYVDSSVGAGGDGKSWAEAFKRLQNAFYVADNDDEIWVAAGTYKPDCNENNPTGTGVRSATFQLIEGVAVYGGFSGNEAARYQRDWTAYETILSGDINIPSHPNDNSYHVVKGADNAIIDGFTITGGYARIPSIYVHGGGGMYCYRASPVISNCIFRGNLANGGEIDKTTGGGGGLFNDNKSSPTVTNCTFSENFTYFCGGGIGNRDGSSPKVTNCTFSKNHATNNGGGISNENSSPKVSNCTFSGNDVGVKGGGMYNDESSPTVTNCTFSGNYSISHHDNGGGGMYNEDSSPILISCTFIGNSAKYEKGGGMYNNNDSSTNPVLINCTFIGNSAQEHGGGMYNSPGAGSANPTVVNCIFWGNNAGIGGNEVFNGASTSPSFSYCDIQDSNGSGDNWDDELGSDDGNNIDLNPSFADVNDPVGPDGIFGTFDDGLRLRINSPCVDIADGDAAPSTDILGLGRMDIGDVNNTGGGEPNYADIGAYELPIIWFVDANTTGGDGTSWDEAFNDLQDALAVAVDGEEVWVAEGIYEPDGSDPDNRSISFELPEDVVVCGGFVGTEVSWTQRDWENRQTILSGDIGTPNDIDDNTYRIVIAADGAVLDGFKITGGNANGSGTESCGGGIYCHSVSPIINNCTLGSNCAVSGGGMYNEYNSSLMSPTVVNCDFVLNYAVNGAGMYNTYSSPAVTNCSFRGNYATNDGGIYNEESRPKVTNCSFIINYAVNGAGMYNKDSFPTIVSGSFWSNFSQSGGGIYNINSSPTMVSCVFAENLAWTNGGGIYNGNNSSPTITSCTLAGNLAEFGGGMFNDNSSPVLANCIFWGNDVNDSGKQIYNSSASPSFSYCDIQDSNGSGGNWDGGLGSDDGNNIDNDPNFIDAYDPVGKDGMIGTPDDGLRLDFNSPCIDAANGNTVPLTDIFGLERIDINDVNNTGEGEPNYADIGAYESYTGIDEDKDGMQNDWELFYGLDPCNPDDADEDPDDDGYLNVWEYLDGTDPTNPASYPDFDAESLPYHTSFEIGEGFYGGVPHDPNEEYEPANLDGQKNWRVEEGLGLVGVYYYGDPNDDLFYQAAGLNTHINKGFATGIEFPDSTALGFVDDNGSNHEYIRLRLYPLSLWWDPQDGCDRADIEVLIKYGPNILAGVEFVESPAGRDIMVWDGSDYLLSSTEWVEDYKELKFKMDYDTHTYDVFYGDDPNAIYTDASFGAEYERLTTIYLNSGWGRLWVDSISINDEPTGGGVPNDDIEITNPCGCEDDKLEGRISVEGSIWWDQLSGYEILFCPVDPEIDPCDPNNLYIADSRYSTGVEDGFLGYWDTGSIPNGYYYLGIQLYGDIFWIDPCDMNNIRYLPYGDALVMSVERPFYSGRKYFPVVSDLKCNTFYHEEEPDISVSWQGQFPFELKRIYNNNRRFYSKPLRNGWTQNNQIVLVEYSTYNWEIIDDSSHYYDGYPAYDDKGIAFGYIWVTYPDGSRKMFRHIEKYTKNYYGQPNGYWGEAKYYPYPENNTGEYIIRTVQVDDYPDYEIDWMRYELYTREGATLVFKTYNDLEIPYSVEWDYGQLFGRVVAPLDTMSDKFGNTLSFSWKETSDATGPWVAPATRAITYNRESGDEAGIMLQFDGQDKYYVGAELRAGSDVWSGDPNDYEVYRTVEYEWDDANNIFKVVKTGIGADANGVYDPCETKEYVTQYRYEDQQNDFGFWPSEMFNLVKVAYGDDINDPSIEVEYDDYGRVALRKDYVDSNTCLLRDFDYTFYHPNPNNKSISYLQTDANTPFRRVTTIQDEKGDVLEQYTITSDGSAVTDVNSFYEDEGNRHKPTDVYEYFDGAVRKTWNDYSSKGDLIEQRVYIDDVNYVSKEMTYHNAVWKSGGYEYPLCVLRDSETSYQAPNKSGQKIQTLYTYGEANGVPDPNEGVYLVAEKILLSGDPCDQNDVWAETEYEYYDDGLMKKKEDPNGFLAFYEYDENGYRELIKAGEDDCNEPVQRFYYDPIGQLRLTANHLGGVTLNDYDDFGRLWRVRTYDDPNALTVPDANFVPDDYNDIEPESTTIYGYDERGNRTYEKKPAGGEIVADYTLKGLANKTTYDDGSYVEYTYDGRGLKILEDYNDITTDLAWHTEFDYDSIGRPNDIRWYDYDGTSIIKHESSEYWGCDKKKYDKIYGYGGETIEKQMDYYYDILGRMTDIVVAPGELDLTTSYSYDAAGNRTSIIDPNGNIIYFDYDGANRKTREYFAVAYGTEKTYATVKKEISYYANGLVKDVNSYDYDSDLLARSEYEYDARRRATKVTQDIDDVNQAVTVYDYNDSGFDVGGYKYQIRITDANDKETCIALDAFGRRVETLYPSSDYEQLEYNGDGTLKYKAVFEPNDAKRWVDYYYDGYGRLIDVNYPDTGNIHYTRDGFGRKTLATDSRNEYDNIGGDSQIAYDYDVLGRIVNVTDQNDYEIIYTYRAGGQKQSITVENPADANIYSVVYYYDDALRLEYVTEPLLGTNDYIAGFDYDDNGNRKQIVYSLDGTSGGDSVTIDYTYNLDNLLTGYSTSSEGVTGPTFTLADVSVDGLGRLTDANETLTKTNGDAVAHLLKYKYDMLSELVDANITNIGGNPWTEQYTYHKNGNIASKTAETFDYDGHLMIDADGTTLNWDENGNMENLPYSGVTSELVYNWDGKLRSATNGTKSINLIKYDPDGNRIFKDSSETGQRKFIVDVTGDLPVILMEINDSGGIEKTYIYANSQIIAQHDGSHTADRYFYLHDRLGSVRQMIDTDGDVANRYTYRPFGKGFLVEREQTIANPFRFTGQWFDSEIGEYYLRARQYNPHIGRFTSRDPVFGKFEEPLSLHKYLYCQNEPVSRLDPWGLMHYGSFETQKVLEAFYQHYETYGFTLGSFLAFYTTVQGQETYIEALFGHPFFGEFDYKGSRHTFRLEPYMDPVKDSDFGNYLAGFAGYYYWGATGAQIMCMAGEWYSHAEYGQPDDPGSKRWIARGILAANLKLKSENRRGFRKQLQEVLVRSTLWNFNIMSFENDWKAGRSFYYAW